MEVWERFGNTPYLPDFLDIVYFFGVLWDFGGKMDRYDLKVFKDGIPVLEFTVMADDVEPVETNMFSKGLKIITMIFKRD